MRRARRSRLACGREVVDVAAEQVRHGEPVPHVAHPRTASFQVMHSLGADPEPLPQRALGKPAAHALLLDAIRRTRKRF